MDILYVLDAAVQTVSGYLLFFFFSSRRRHTRCSRDWSSDVCSSDLPGSILHITSFGVARKTVAEPPVISRGGTDRDTPPLMRDGIRQQTIVDLVGNPSTGDGCDFRCPG